MGEWLHHITMDSNSYQTTRLPLHLPARHQMTFVPFRFNEGRIFPCPIPRAHLSLSVELHGLQSSDIGRQSELNAFIFETINIRLWY